MIDRLVACSVIVLTLVIVSIIPERRSVTPISLYDCGCFVGVSDGNLPIGVSGLLVSVQSCCGQALDEEVVTMLRIHLNILLVY